MTRKKAEHVIRSHEKLPNSREQSIEQDSGADDID